MFPEDYDDDRIFFQDRPGASLRVWSTISTALTGVLVLPPVQAELTALLPAVIPAPYVPLATVVLAGALSALSKAKDKRPVAPKRPIRPKRQPHP
jgi:hypothetical protein